MANELSDLIIIRSVYGKVGQRVYTNPCKDPNTGMFPEHVKMINSKGDLLLTDEERNSGKVYIPVNKQYILEDGTTFDLSKPVQAADWYAIQHCPLIAFSRDARDKNGNYIIDGGEKRYGKAELYVERPGHDTVRKVSKRKLIHDAESFIYNDPSGSQGRRLKAKVLGRPMDNAHDADVQDFLLEIASKHPQRIIDIYTGSDLNLRLLFIEAKDAGIIYVKNKVYLYSDQQIPLGASDDAVINWMKNPTNSRILNLIKNDLHPELNNVAKEVTPSVSEEEINRRVAELVQKKLKEEQERIEAEAMAKAKAEIKDVMNDIPQITDPNIIPKASSSAKKK